MLKTEDIKKENKKLKLEADLDIKDDFNSIEKNLIKSLKKEVLSKDDIEFRFAYYKMLFDPVLDLAEKAIKQYVKVIKAADNENISEEELTCRILELFESDLMNKLTE